MLPKPFVGSFGIVSNDGIPKPNFWGFKMLSQLYPQRLSVAKRTDEDVEYAAFVDGEKTQILIFTQNQDYYRNESYELDIEVGAPTVKATIERIDDSHCNPKAEWVRLGSPDNLTREEVSDIKARTRLVAEDMPFVSEDGVTKLTVNMKTNEVVLISLE